MSFHGHDSSWPPLASRSEEHTSELQSQSNLVYRLLLEKKNSPGCGAHELRRTSSPCLSTDMTPPGLLWPPRPCTPRTGSVLGRLFQRAESARPKTRPAFARLRSA